MRHSIKNKEKIRQITNVWKFIDIEIKKQYQIKQFKRNLINLINEKAQNETEIKSCKI